MIVGGVALGIMLLKIFQATHMLYFAPYRSLFACLLAALILALEAAIAFLYMLSGFSPSTASNNDVSVTRSLARLAV